MSVDVDYFLDAPDIAKIPDGYDALHRVWLVNTASVAAPIANFAASGVVNINTTPFSPQSTKEIYHEGAGEDNYAEKRRRHRGDFTVQMHSGYVEEFIATIKGITLASYAALPTLAHDDPMVHWEIVVREPDGTHVVSKVWRHLILREWAFASPMEEEIVDIPFYTKLSPFSVYNGNELVVDKFDGDGSTTDFTLSATPIDAVDASNQENIDWFYDNLVDVFYKTSAQSYGNMQRSGWSAASTTLTATTAPAASSVVTATYVKATS